MYARDQRYITFVVHYKDKMHFVIALIFTILFEPVPSQGKSKVVKYV